jgi:DNA repair ATPase RecN
MSTATLTAIVEPLVRRKLFATTEEAMLELMQDYTLRQISSYQSQIAELERKYGMSFTKFTQYLHERGATLQSKELSPQQRQSLGRALMAEEDDWLDWKVATEMLQSWLGLREEVAG